MKPVEVQAPYVSIVLVAYNIPRELPRTLKSLSAEYQRDVEPHQYEVVVVDNGSTPPVSPELIRSFGDNFRLVRIDDASPSPAGAMNRGIAAARGEVVAIMIDGARIVTPGFVHFGYQGTRLCRTAVVATLGWYLGYDLQRWSMKGGHDAAYEDALLAQIDWPRDGYRLFDISTMDESSAEGWFSPITESNGLFLRREQVEQLGGMDERFVSPGGGLVNLDLLQRALQLPDAQLVIPLGEATFHQFHGGVATNMPAELMHQAWEEWDGEYERIRGKRFEIFAPAKPAVLIGTLCKSARARLAHAAARPARAPPEWPFDGENHEQAGPDDATAAALTNLVHDEYVSRRYESAVGVARIVRDRYPDRLESLRLVSLIAHSNHFSQSDDPQYLCAVGDAYRLLAEDERAAASYRGALRKDPDAVRAHVGLSLLRAKGDLYYSWLEKFYDALAPRIVVEIGVESGHSIALVRPPALAIGIDPSPSIVRKLSAETCIFPETSDEFFRRKGGDSPLTGRCIDVAFIDGLHLFEQALKDFINIERFCDAQSVVLIHDTMPLDEATQDRERSTRFHTGDVWKLALCLISERPDLDVFTIPTPWTGLTVVTGFRRFIKWPARNARNFARRYQDNVDRFVGLGFRDIESDLHERINIVPDSWSFVEARLRRNGIVLRGHGDGGRGT